MISYWGVTSQVRLFQVFDGLELNQFVSGVFTDCGNHQRDGSAKLAAAPAGVASRRK